MTADNHASVIRLHASVIVRNELGRYLAPFLDHLLAFCDAVTVVDDGSTDGTDDWLYVASMYREAAPNGDESPIRLLRRGAAWEAHEGQARQALLDWTLTGNPTHVLSIDADEFVSDGAALRAAIEANPYAPALQLCMCEVWEADEGELRLRTDGGWRPTLSPLVYAVPELRPVAAWQIRDRALACGREPEAVRRLPRASLPAVDVSVYHLGWANESERARRHERYVRLDGGSFHARHHLDSIVWPRSRVQTCAVPLPPWPAPIRESVLAAVREQR